MTTRHSGLGSFSCAFSGVWSPAISPHTSPFAFQREPLITLLVAERIDGLLWLVRYGLFVHTVSSRLCIGSSRLYQLRKNPATVRKHHAAAGISIMIPNGYHLPTSNTFKAAISLFFFKNTFSCTELSQQATIET